MNHFCHSIILYASFFIVNAASAMAMQGEPATLAVNSTSEPARNAPPQAMAPLTLKAGVGQTSVIALKDKYHSIEVPRFDVQQGVLFPPDYIAALQDDIVKQLQKSGKLQEVRRPSEKQVNPGEPMLRLTGTVNHFKPGSRAKRYFGGPLGGSTEIFALLALIDAATGQTLGTQEVHAVLAGGFFGGESMNVTSDFARRVVTAAQLMIEKGLPEHTPQSTGEAPPKSSAGVAEEYSLSITSSEMSEAQSRLDAQAALGYRVSGAEISGKKTAVLRLEKSATPPEVYQSSLFHANLPGTMQKQLNRAGGEGFRLVPHTLMPNFAGILSWIMEKAPANPHYGYRRHETFRVSRAQHDIEKDQKEGYTLVDTTEISGGHIVILEKVVEAKGN